MFETLQAMAVDVADRSILDLFEDESRAATFSAQTGDLRFDYSKTQIDGPIRAELLRLAEAADVMGRARAMFAGEKINETEGRAVLHTALRNLDGGPVMVDGRDEMPGVLDTLADMERFATAVRDGSIAGQGGAITDVVNIGIGGSDLGPKMATLALAPYHDGPRLHYVSNVDGAHISETLRDLDPQTTLFIIASKTFTTQETMANAHSARRWFLVSIRWKTISR